VEPAKAQKLLDSYKENLDNVSSQLLKSKLTSYLAIFTLLFLLGFADYEAFFVYGVEGWCPEWPGLDNLPGSLFDKETGLAAIPQYWLGDDFFEQAQ
jgi:type IV secretory pathway VirB6-like protein